MPIRAVIKNPFEPAHEHQIDEHDELAELQKLVGGYIEAVQLDGLGLTGLINDEGKLKDLTPNVVTARYGLLVGPVVVVGPPDHEGNETSLTDDQVREAIQFLNDRAVTPLVTSR